jgi:hypothetical protein
MGKRGWCDGLLSVSNREWQGDGVTGSMKRANEDSKW